VISNVFKTDINAFLSCVLGVFKSLVATPAHGLARVFDYDLYRRTHACLLRVFVPLPKVPLH